MKRSVVTDSAGFGRFAPGRLTARLLEMTDLRSTNWAGKRGAFILRAIAVRALAGKPLDVERLGARMRLYPYNNVSEKRILFTPQYFDAAERALLGARIDDGFHFVDVGASVGGYALFVAAKAGPRAKVLAVEPDPEVFERLVFNIRANPFGTVKAIACAVADLDGEITLFVDAHNRGESSMRIVNADPSGGQIKVPAKTLLSLLRDEGYAKLDAVKIDVEGAEDLILEPFFRTAPPALWPKLVVLANAPARWAIDLPELVVRRGYAQTLRTRDNLVFERT